MENFLSAVTSLLFDMDITLFDLVEAQVAACHAVAKHPGQHDGEDLFSYFLTQTHGFESHENIRQYMEERNIACDSLYRTACRGYEEVKLHSIFPYEGVFGTYRSFMSEGIVWEL
jgi:putative hydrolase of the HAD superfamily